MKCPKCNSTLCYVRIKTKENVCRSCGEITEIKTVKKKLKSFAGFEK